MSRTPIVTDAVMHLGIVDRDEPHDVASPYVEHYWLPVIGPSCYVLARRLAEIHYDAADHDHDIVQVDLVTLAQDVGLTHTPGSSRGIGRQLARLAEFNVGRFDDATTYRTRVTLPNLPTHLTRRLTEHRRRQMVADHIKA